MTKLYMILLLCVLSCYAYKSTTWKLTVISDPDKAGRQNKIAEIYPTVYSSPVGNLNNHIFAIFKAEPLDACTKITELNFTKYPNAENYSSLIVVDGMIGTCGVRRRIQMVKDIGAKGLIILNDDLDDAIEPYGDYSDNTFLVFVAKKQQYLQLLTPDSYITTLISTQTSKKTKSQLQFWLSTLNTKSYQLISIWDQTIRQIPAIAKNSNWKPRYALWGCNSGHFAPGSVCTDDSEYLRSCACRGDFCSPETNYKAADATVKEDIRQKIIYNSYQNKYLAYIIGFKNACLKTFQTSFYAQDCASSIDHVALSKKVDDFMNKCEGDIYEGLLLDRNRFSQLGEFPAVILDRQSITYTSKRDFQVQVCKKLGLDQEQGCVKVLKVNTITNFAINVFFFIFIIGGVSAIVAVLLCVYRKTIRKQMQKEMKMQVSASVEHYFALTQSK